MIDDGFIRELLQKLNELRKANFKCDTTVRVEGQDFPAHSNVLSAASEYFRALFSSELQVKENEVNLVELHEMNSTTIAEVLQFIYTGEASINSSNAQNLILASDYLIIPSLKSKAAQFFAESMNASNCLALESFASQYNCDSLRQAALKHKCQHFVTVVKSEDFMSLGFEEVKELMCEDELDISEEEDVYEAMMEWVKHDLLSRECFLPDLLKCLRLFSMSKYSLRKILNTEELVIKNPICTTILNSGLDFFLFPDRFLGTSLKHRTSIEKEEHVVILTGGESDDGEDDATDCFVLGTKKWYPLSKIPRSCISEESIAYVSAVCGGFLYGMDGKTARVSCFNPKDNTWRARITRLSSHKWCTLTSFNEDLYLIGGIHLDAAYNDVVRCEVHKYNPISNEWTQLASMDTVRAAHCAVVLEDLIYVIAGHNGQACLNDMVRYNPKTDQWSNSTSLLNARVFAAAASVCGKILVIGGYCDMNETNIERTCEIFDPCLDQWSLVPSLDETVYVFGGEDEENWLLSVECFDVNRNEWTEVDSDMPRTRTRAQASLLKVPKKFISAQAAVNTN